MARVDSGLEGVLATEFVNGLENAMSHIWAVIIS